MMVLANSSVTETNQTRNEVIIVKPTLTTASVAGGNSKSASFIMPPLFALQLLIILVLSSTPLCSSFTLAPSKARDTNSHGLIINWRSTSVAASQIAILDGSDLASLENFLRSEKSPPPISPSSSSAAEGRVNKLRLGRGGDRIACCSIVTGSLTDGSNSNTRVVGIALEPSKTDITTSAVEIKGDGGELISIYEDSMAHIPISISDSDAISTCAASLVGIHCAVHDPLMSNIVTNVGGSKDEFVAPMGDVSNKKIAIMGGGEYACFLADGVSAIGASVTQVTTAKMKARNNAPRVSILPPAVGNLSLGFASALGTFDCLVDTLADEADVGEIDRNGSGGQSVISLLREQHGCERYISTMSKSQKIILDDGIIFGRGKADTHVREAELTLRNSAQSIVPPKKFGQLTLQKLLDGGVIFKNRNKSAWIQSWSLKDFWEYTSWPRDTSGGANVRFGLPVVDELDISLGGDSEEEEMIAEPLRPISGSPVPPKDKYEGQKNPYILNIKGLDELENVILSKDKDCVLFLSASYCRTCKYITPQYTRLAREMKEGESDVLIAQTDAGRGSGKELGKFLNVESVPAFVLFREGKIYGDTLTISRLPSRKMNLALDLLSSGQEWDRVALRELK